MALVFTKHAEERMKERNVSRFMVEAIVATPDSTANYYDGVRVFKQFGDKTFVVGIDRDGATKIVTTVFVKEKRNGR